MLLMDETVRTRNELYRGNENTRLFSHKDGCAVSAAPANRSLAVHTNAQLLAPSPVVALRGFIDAISMLHE